MPAEFTGYDVHARSIALPDAGSVETFLERLRARRVSASGSASASAGFETEPRDLFAEPWSPERPRETPRGLGDPDRAYSVLAYGQSSRSESRHFDDQARMFAEGRMKPVSFTEEQIRQGLVRRYRPGLGSVDRSP